jgi:drug/metabolite transporter (DMT)-like permease
MVGRDKMMAISSLLTGATVWGLIWYPYRLLETAGLGGAAACSATYLVALVGGVMMFHRTLRAARFSWWLLAIAISAAGCNLGYIVAVLNGEVMRVLLLFYLSPLWTVLMSRLLLDERLSRDGAKVIALSLAGAMVMLWRPQLGFPWPRDAADWIALGAGFSFAVQNVVIRKTAALSVEQKVIAVFVGVIGVGLILIPFEPPPTFARLGGAQWLIVASIGVVMLVANIVVQYGLMRLPANQAIVIYLFELVVAALSSWWLAGETMGAREWVGGAMIVVASVFSGKLEHKAVAT